MYIISNATISVKNLALVVKTNTRVIMAENEVGENQTKLDVALKLLEGCFFNSTESENTLNENFIKTVAGVKRYATAEDMNAAGNEYTSFNDAYWTVADGVLSWKA